MSANPGNKLSAWSPTPPERGSFPLDHQGECKEYMELYLKCMKIVRNDNAPNCRTLLKNYLNCRMDHQLMDRVSWDKLGLPEDQVANVDKLDKLTASSLSNLLLPEGSE